MELHEQIKAMEEENSGYATYADYKAVAEDLATRDSAEKMEFYIMQDVDSLDGMVATYSDVEAMVDSHTSKSELAEMEGKLYSELTAVEDELITNDEISLMASDYETFRVSVPNN